MLELAQLPEAATYSGRSLARYWNPRPDPAAASPVIAMMYGPEGTAWSLMADGYHYIEWYDGEAKLFAMSDEKETRDLAAVPESRPILERFAALRSEYSRKLAESGAAASR
jgi:hypothetical protein